MLLSFVVYAGAVLAFVGGLSVLVPVRFLGIRHRGVAVLLALAGATMTTVAMAQPADSQSVSAPHTRLDDYAPAWQFDEVNEIPVHASADRIYAAITNVTAAEIPLYRTLAWIRRGFASGPESILNPPDHDPLVAVATRTTFLKLADDPGREFVMGTVVIAPPGVRLALGTDPESFTALTQPGYAKATVAFRIEPGGTDWHRLRTETRVFGTDPDSVARFAKYWRVIGPGSQIIRIMWLRAIKVRAEAPGR